MSNPQHESDPLLRLLAWSIVFATFPLIWIGGLVTTTNAGMAVPDWPGTYGHNLFLYPWQKWIQGPWDLFVEHGHRLFASGVGLLTILLCISVWRKTNDYWARMGAFGLLGMVLLQGALGGVRVLFDERVLARVHGCVGPVFLLMAIFFASWISSWGISEGNERRFDVRSYFRTVVTLLSVSLSQLAVGSFIRHVSHADSPSLFSAMVYFHLLGAGLITWFAYVVCRQSFQENIPVLFRRGSWALASIVLVQLGLGAGSWVVRFSWPAWMQGFDFAAKHTITVNDLIGSLIRTGHVANGSVLLAVLGYLVFHSYRRLPAWSGTRYLSTSRLQGVAL